LGGVPARLVAALHDTSIPMIEATYSRHISEHGDELVRRALIETDPPTAGNVVTLPGRRT